MSHRAIGTVALLAGLAMTQPALAQQASSSSLKASDFISMRPAGPDDIIVTAPPRATPDQIQHQARKISQVDGSAWEKPLARIHARVCPGIMGLRQDMAELLVDRIRYNAERVGLIPASADGCVPNIFVIFTLDGRAQLKALTRTQGFMFKEVPKHEIDDLLRDPGPVHLWTYRVTRSRFGDQAIGNDDDLNQPPTVKVQNSHSHIWLATRQDIEAVVMLIDIKAIDGLSIDQIADYATMRSFARTQPTKGGAAADTILTLFDPDGRHAEGLTPFDLAYLKGLYDSYDSVRAVAVMGATRREMQKEAKTNHPANAD